MVRPKQVAELMRQKARHHNRVTPFICIKGTYQFINLVGQVSLKPKCSPYLIVAHIIFVLKEAICFQPFLSRLSFRSITGALKRKGEIIFNDDDNDADDDDDDDDDDEDADDDDADC